MSGIKLFTQNYSNKNFINLIRVITLLLIFIILMSGGEVVVSIAKISYAAIEGIFLALLVSIVLTFILKPVMLFIEGFNIRREIAITLIFLAITIAIITTFGKFIPAIEGEVGTLQQEIPKYQAAITGTITKCENYLKSKSTMFASVNIFQTMSTIFKEQLNNINKANILASSTKMIGSLFTLILMVPFITFFLLKDGWLMKKNILAIIPNRYFEMSLNLFHEINKQLGVFIRARIIEALCVGIICFIGLSILGVKYTSVLAIFAALLNLIPYIGPFIGAIPAIFVAFVETGQWSDALWVIIIFGAAQLFDIFIIIPTLFSKIVDMHPLIVVLVIIVGGQLGGIIGMILAVPIYSIFKVTVKEVHSGFRSMIV